MDIRHPITSFHPSRCLKLVALLVVVALSGCQALTSPVQEGIPPGRVPPEYLGYPREEEKTIPLDWLVQKRPKAYLLDAGDVLGIYIEGITGDRTQPPPLLPLTAGSTLQPAFGYPYPVSDDGTLALPLVAPGKLSVKGLTLPEAQKAIVDYYETPRQIDWFLAPKALLNPGAARVSVTIYRQRQVHVQVVRQDGGNTVSVSGAGTVQGSNKRGTGAVIDLPAYENDVLNALDRTNGLPGLDAVNEVRIQRVSKKEGEDGQFTRIPLRIRPGQSKPFKPEDILLETGDIVFIEARDTELFYAGGLLPPKQYALPRDYDLRAIDAIALANGPLINGGFQANNLTGAIQPTGLGTPNPSRLAIVRRTKNYGQLVIIVDLNKAFRDKRENILIQPGDVLILEQTPVEALTQYFSQTIRFNYLATLVNQAYLQVTSTATLF